MHGDLGTAHDERVGLEASRARLRERIIEQARDIEAVARELDPEHRCGYCLTVRELEFAEQRLRELSSPEDVPAG